MTTVYISGPMRGIPRYNFPAFDAARDALVAQGFTVLSPADIDRAHGFCETDPEPGPETLRAMLARDAEAVLISDRVVLLDNWRRSRGAVAEAMLAVAAGIPLYDQGGSKVAVTVAIEVAPAADEPSHPTLATRHAHQAISLAIQFIRANHSDFLARYRGGPRGVFERWVVWSLLYDCGYANNRFSWTEIAAVSARTGHTTLVQAYRDLAPLRATVEWRAFVQEWIQYQVSARAASEVIEVLFQKWLETKMPRRPRVKT